MGTGKCGIRSSPGWKSGCDPVRDPEVTRDSAGYGQVAHLRSGVHPELGILWVAAASPLTAPFIPYWLAVTNVPPEFKWHRYLTDGEAGRFMNAEF